MAPVEIRELSKRFGDVAAVNGLSFDVEAGRVTGFLGPNGAGKSTTLRALLGLVRPIVGLGHVRRPPLRRARAARRPRRRGARGRLVPSRSQRAQPPARPGRDRRPSRRPRRRGARRRSGSTDAADRRVKGYSHGHAPAPGDRRRAARRPAGADPRRADQRPGPDRASAGCAGSCASRPPSGRAVLVSSHVLAEVAQSVDDVVVIADGELRAHGTARAGARRRRRPGDRGPRAGPGPARRRARTRRPPRRARRRRPARARRRRPSRSAGSPARSAWRCSVSRRAHALARGGVLRADRRPGMTTLLQAELLKLRTTRTFAALVGTAAALSLLLIGVAASSGMADDPTRSCSPATSRASSCCCSARSA